MPDTPTLAGARSRGQARPGPSVRLRKLGHRPVLDGLRGLAFLLVFSGHAGWLPFLRPAETAMFLFFALSGFLITQLLVEEREGTGSIRLRRFFARRALRLLPALIAFLAVWMIVVLVFSGSGWTVSAPGKPGSPSGGLPPLEVLKLAGAVLAYVANWMQIYGHESSHQPLTHLWSLSVEEQFYVIWAPLTALVLSTGALLRRRSAARRGQGTGSALLVIVAVVLVVASLGAATWHFFLHSVHDPRVSYGTDTRAGAFLLGGALAIAWSRHWIERAGTAVRRALGTGLRLKASPRLASILVVAVALCLLWSGRIEGDAQGDLAKSLSYLAATVTAPLLVVALVGAPLTPFGRVLSHPVATYIGRRSYALYLWHYVLLTWFHELGGLGDLLALGASFLLAEASWRLVESPALSLKRRFEPEGRLPGRHPEAAVETDRLPVQVWVLGDGADELRELGRLAEALREEHPGAERLARLLREKAEEGGVHEPGCDRVDADPRRREVAGSRQGHGDDPAL